MRGYNKPPFNLALRHGMLVMILRGHHMPGCRYNTPAASFAPIDAGVWSFVPRLRDRVECSVVEAGHKLLIFVDSHSDPFRD